MDLTSLVEELSVALYRSTPDGQILYANPALAELLGAPSTEALGSVDVWTDLGYPRQSFADEIHVTGSVRNLVMSWTRRTGERVHTRETARAVLDDAGEVLYYEGVMEDVTAEVEAQREERAVARQHRAIAAFAAAAATEDPAVLHESAARALLDATGADWAALATTDGGAARLATTAGEPPPALAGLVSSVAGDGLPARAYAVASSDDPTGDLQAAGVPAAGFAPVRSGDAALGLLVWGKAGGGEITATDVRGAEALAWHLSGHLDRAQALGDLRDSEASLAVIAERTPHVLYRLRYAPEGAAFDYLSPAVESLTGYSKADLAARGGIDGLIEHRDVRQGEGLASRPVPGADRYHALYQMATAHGPRWVENDARPWLDDAGRPVGLVGVLQDVTERKAREDRLADAAQTALIRQRALVDLSHLSGADAFGGPAASVAAATLDAAAVSFWSCPADGPCRPLHAPAPADRQSFDGDLKPVVRHVAQHRALAISDVRDDPRVAEMQLGGFARAYGLRSLLVAPVRRDGRVKGLVVIHRHDPHGWDPSETEFAAAVADAVAMALEREDHEQAAQALAVSQQRYQALAEMASDYALAVVERDGRAVGVEWATGACARVSGYTVAELASLDVVRSLVHRDSAEAVRAMAADWRAHGEARAEIQIRTQSGETRWVDHHARIGPTTDDGAVVVYHSGQDVTDRKRNEAALVEARLAAEEGREAAERLSRLKSSFLANMSHEVRTPLTGILGFADLLSAEVPEEQRDFVAHIERNGRRLLDTLNAVLDLSQLDAGEYHSVPAPLRLSGPVSAAAADYRKVALDKGLRLDLDLAPDVAASVDATVLKRITGYLLSNAVKFTESGGVRVSVEGQQGEAVLRVSDTGVGISESFMPAAFEAFRQEESGHARSHEGSGLGLAVVQRLVALSGGAIDVQSSQPGGTAVTVTFPRVAAPAEAEPAKTAPTKAEPAPEHPAETLPPAHGDGQSAPADAVEVRLAPAAEPAPASQADVPLDDLLGAPFDFTFLSAPADPPPTATPPPPAPTDMFDFRFGRDSAPKRPAEPAAPAPPPAAPAPAAPPARPAAPLAPAAGTQAPSFPSQAPASPSAPTQAPPAPPPSEPPVMIVRAQPNASATIPQATAGGPTEEAEVVAGDGRPSVLVVEDNEDTRMLLERILRSTYDVTVVGDARSALLAMNQRRFSGLVLDINLGGKETGADVLRIARSLPNYDGVFAIALTAYALPGDRERLLESGFNEYISKPFTRSSLMETLAAGVQA